MANTMRITHRVVNTKKHTTGFVLTGGKEVTRYQAVQLARKGLIKNVRVVRSNNKSYLMGDSTSLYSLPVRVEA